MAHDSWVVVSHNLTLLTPSRTAYAVYVSHASINSTTDGQFGLVC